MRLGFGAQKPADLTRWMLKNRKWLMEVVWFRRVGRPAREISEYHELELIALMTDDDAQDQGDNFGGDHKLSPYSPLGGGRIFKPLKLPTKWDEAIETGDPVADEWERQIARGETPELD